jgi:glycosyltransferase involved in cell wall biosynthesis
MKIESTPLVSVVIPTFNSEHVLPECLESIKNQTYPAVEIIVVDGHSSDSTMAIAGKYATVYSFGPDQTTGRVFGAPYQRNYGVTMAQGKYVYYVDSDMRLLPGLIEECVRRIETEKAAAVIVPEFSYGEGFWSQCRVLEKKCYFHDPLVDAARFIRRDVWQALGGLDASLGGGDDWDFQRRLNQAEHKTIQVTNHVWHYEGCLRLIKQMRKKYVYGKTVDRYFKKYANDKKFLLRQYSLLRPAYFRHWPYLVDDPLHAAGMLFMKTCEYGAAGLGFLVARFAPSRIKLKGVGEEEHDS